MEPPGPAALGRGVVVRRGDDTPPGWLDAEVVPVDDSTLREPAPIVAVLHRAWTARRAVVVELAVDAEAFRIPVSIGEEPWRLGARYEVWLDRLHFLVWANTYDARDGKAPVWWWARKAARLGAAEVDAGPGDVTLGDGARVWVDGGPRGPLDPAVLGAGVVHREAIERGRLAIEPAPVRVGAALAPDQLAAVEHGAGPARIVAPAGSGKTRVLTERLRHLVVDRGLARDDVLAVAYNKKAQVEMEERTSDFGPRVSTLNALGYRLVAEHAGRPPRVLDEREVRGMVDDLVPRGRPRANTDRLAPYLEGLTAIRLGLRDPDDVEGARDDVPGLAAAFEPYRAALAGAGAVDFDEQVYRAVELLLTDGQFRRGAQARHRHLLVDEFQDLTPAHMLLLRLLSAPALDVFGVGDDDQVIYGHAGADPAFLIEFDQLFPLAAAHPLEVNYRCPVEVVRTARTLLSYNHVRVAKEIRSGPDASTDADAFTVRRHRPDAGAAQLLELMDEWISVDHVPPSDIAVLTRVNSLLLAPHVALVEAGVSVRSPVSSEMLERTGVRAALAYLRLGATPGRLQPDDLQEVLRRPSRGLPPWISKWLQRTMSIDDLRGISERIDDEKVGAKVVGLADDLVAVAEAVGRGSTREVLSVVADEIGLGGAMSLLDGSKGGQSGSQLDDLDALAQVAALHPDPVTFERWLRGVLARPRDPAIGVTLSTVHRVKGMEWDRVVVAGVTEGVLPHRLAENEEEERRVLHVAITRGRDRVVVLADASRPSPFLGELDGSAPRRPPRAAPARTSADGATKARTTKDPLPDLPAEAARADAALRAWRLERCRADKVAAYIVASNAVLRAIATRRPASLDELATVDGIGPTKLDLYGDEILAVLDALPA